MMQGPLVKFVRANNGSKAYKLKIVSSCKIMDHGPNQNNNHIGGF